MSLATYKRLDELEKAINDKFKNTGCPPQGCPPGPRAHLVYAHYGARSDPAKAMEKWTFATITSYEGCTEPRHVRAARDYLGAHFLWVLTKDAKLEELPNLTEDVKATVADGGTLVRFKSTNFDKDKVPTKASGPTKIPDFTLVDRYTGTAAGVEDGTGFPKRRRICLSVPGSNGAHKDVDGANGTVQEKLSYPVPPQDNELRLLGIAPGFKFEVRGKANTAVAETDPWTQSTRDLTAAQVGKKLYEASSSTFVGHTTTSRWGNGVARYSGDAGSTTTVDLATTYGTHLGASRSMVFKALKNVEGACESVATYDGPKLSWGINQWTLPGETGELWQILAYIYDFFPNAFARRFGYYGIGLWFESRAATWDRWNTYRNVVVYRIPCCGPKTRSGIDALFAAAKAAADPKTAGTGGDKPPTVAKKVADAFKVSRRDTTSFAMAHVFATAGADADIQKAQAQWMSYRISSTSPVGKTIDTAIDEFLKSLGSNMSATDRYNSAVKALKGELGTADKVKEALDEKFSDDDATKEWIDWPTRCKNAGKSTGSTSTRSSTTSRTTRAGTTGTAKKTAAKK